MEILNDVLKKANLPFLGDIEWIEKTPGRYFSKVKIDMGNGYKHFFVLLGPNVESPIHNHEGQNIEETHLLLYGSGKFLIYEKETRELVLKQGEFHKIFTSPESNPDHQYISGPEGSVSLALEKHY